MWKINKNLKKILALVVPAVLVFMLLACLCGCTSSFYIDGSSYGYFIWEDSSSNIHIAWSADKKDTTFKGKISTDGEFVSYSAEDFEENDRVGINSEKNEIIFDASLSAKDYSDKIIILADNYSYIEFDLKMNDGYDTSRVNVGQFLNNPDEEVFRTTPGYFESLKDIPFYKKHPVSGFVSKFSGDIGFTLFYVFIIGVVIIEIIRITAIRKNRKYNRYLILCYGVLIVIEAALYFLLKRAG
jgi:hypothetical protein